jgi:putative ABC transport system ATP-binding protein
VRDLTKTYDLGDLQVHALRGVTLDVLPGEFVALTGPSGSASRRSCTCSAVSIVRRREIFPEWTGRVGRVETRAVAGAQQASGLRLPGFNLLPRTSAVENVELPLLYAGSVPARERRERAVAALRAVGLGDRLDHHPNQLSGGQQQRVAIARALVNNPTLLLADEPTGNLDTRTSIDVMGIFQRLNEDTGLTIVLVTHEPDIAEYGTRIVAFRDGRVLSDRPVDTRRIASVELARLVEEAA